MQYYLFYLFFACLKHIPPTPQHFQKKKISFPPFLISHSHDTINKTFISEKKFLKLLFFLNFTLLCVLLGEKNKLFKDKR